MKNACLKFISAVCLLSAASCSKPNNTTPEPPIVPPPVVVTPPPATDTDVLTIANVRTYMVDPSATNETVALFYNLKKLAKTKIAIGQQDAFAGFYKDAGGDADIKKATGFDPAIAGSDFMFITDKSNDGTASNWFHQQEVMITNNIIKAYDKGIVNILCWHLREPNKENSFYASDMTDAEKNTAFKSILPGGIKNDWFKMKLDKVASVLQNLKGADGKLIPVIFRPFHEYDGSWFWWGTNFCTADEFKTAYQFLVDYLVKTKGVHNVLFALGPDNSYDTDTKYLSRYPGDRYVDVLGMDNYGDFRDVSGQAGSDLANKKLKVVADLAKAKVKIAALTEAGYAVDATHAPVTGWFSNYVYNALTANDVQVSFVMFWVNSSNSYYVPVPGTANLADFTSFVAKPKSVLLNNLPKMYELPK